MPRNTTSPGMAVNVRRVGAPGWSQMHISRNLSDRWGKLISRSEDKEHLLPLEENAGLLETLRAQMFDEITFIVRKDGQYGILFEVETCSSESEAKQSEEDPDWYSSLKSHKEVVAALLAGIEILERCFPDVTFCVPEQCHVFQNRAAVWAFVPNGKLSTEERVALGNALLGL